MKKISLLLAIASVFVLSQAKANVTIAEDFATDPLTNGWQVFGDADLFQWDSVNQNLAVTWDSSQPNSYFYQPLGLTADKADSFTIAFDLRIDDIGPTSDTNKQFSFNLSIGLLNLSEATQPWFLRGTGFSSPDLAEFSYFWDSGFGTTAWPLMVDSQSDFNFNSSDDYSLFTVTNGDWHHVCMTYTASNNMIVTTLTNLAQNTGVTIVAPLASYFTDLSVDAISISSYNDTDGFGGSIFAHGAVDNLVVTVKPAPIKKMNGNFVAGAWHVNFMSQTNWTYTLERTTDFSGWNDATSPIVGNGTNLDLPDLNAPPANAFYRVRADQP